MAGLFVTRNYTVVVQDSSTSKPVVKALVSLGGKAVETNTEGKATISVKPGSKKLLITKKYYSDASQTVVVNIGESGNSSNIVLSATGRQVPITVTNKITGKPLEGVTLQAADSETKTDKEGKAVFVLPTNSAKQKTQVSLGGYTALTTEVTITDIEVPENKLALTPSGKVFFLSNQSGKIDVVSTNLDGSDRKVVLAGAGKEDRHNTVLLASRDWKYLALSARRDGDKNKLYLIETASSQLTTMDEGNATFNLAGWSDHYFVYIVNRNGIDHWQPKDRVIKTYNAQNKQIKTLEEIQGVGTASYNYVKTTFSDVQILADGIVYGVSWAGLVNPYDHPPIDMTNRRATLIKVKPDGSDRQVVREFVLGDIPWSYFNSFIELRRYNAQELYVRVNNKRGTDGTFYEYAYGKLEDLKDYSANQFYGDSYVTFLVSPGGKRTFWNEIVDGKSRFFIGDQDGENGKTIGSFEKQVAYGWYTDEYVLMKKDSELYIMHVDGGAQLKVTDFYTPYSPLYGYGYGYGGI
jgi:hypothetical protein